MMAEINLFTYLNQIQNKKRNVLYDKKIASAWIISMWLSQEKSYINKVCDIIRYLNELPDEVIYEYYMSILPKGKKYIKWTKKRKEEEKIKKNIEQLKKEYPEMSTRECKMIIKKIVDK